jgi:hypothetical protein
MPEPRYVLVPVEPTEEMFAAQAATAEDHWPIACDRQKYAAMLAASPDPTQDAALVELVVRTIYERMFPFVERCWGTEESMLKSRYRDTARAVLALVRGR